MTRARLTTFSIPLLTAFALATLPACENSNSPDQVSAPASSGSEHDDHTGHDHSDHEGHDHASPDQSGSDHASHAETDADPAPSGVRVSAADYSFSLPQGWERREPSNSMRLFELAAPGVGDAPQPIAAFSLAGGPIDANITRWVGQFAEPDAERSRETRQLAGTTVHLVEMAGTFRGMGGPAQEDTVMRAAIVERPGQPNLFIKMTGGSAAMDAAKDGWTAMIESITTP